MKVVFIAGAFRGDTPWDVEQNIRVAEHGAMTVAEIGAVALCPHTMYRFFDKTLPDEFWLEATKELLRRCDGIFMCHNWEVSSGSRGEKELAERLGMPVFYDTPESRRKLELWLNRKGIQYDEGEKLMSELPRLDLVTAIGVVVATNYNPDEFDPGDYFRFQDTDKWGDAIWEVIEAEGAVNKRIKFRRYTP